MGATQTAVAVAQWPVPTLQVYGDPLQHPQTENYRGNVNPIGKRSCYDDSKRAAECLAFGYQREHNLEVRRRMLCVSLVTGAAVWGCTAPTAFDMRCNCDLRDYVCSTSDGSPT